MKNQWTSGFPARGHRNLILAPDNSFNFKYSNQVQQNSYQPLYNIQLQIQFVLIHQCCLFIVNRQNLNMSFSKNLQAFKDRARIVLNDNYMGDEGAHQLAAFLSQHGQVQSLQIKSNNITATGFIEIFRALQSNPIKQLIAEYNDLGTNEYEDWQSAMDSMISRCPKLERLNISNNKITSDSFSRIILPISQSKSLKLLQIRYNTINSEMMTRFLSQLQNSHNSTLLYVQAAGNKINKQAVDSLESFLKNNRKKNPISKDKLMMTDGSFERVDNFRQTNTFNRTNAIDDLSKQNILAHLQNILDQNRRDTAEMKVRLQNQLSQLQRRQKLDAKELIDLDNKCNELIIQNRNLKFEYDRTISEHQQLERDQEIHMKSHQQKLRQANRELQDLQTKYEDIQNKMNKEHEMKMKQIARDWQSRLRSMQQKIRTTENDNMLIQNEIRKHMEKRERLKLEYAEEQNIVRARVEDEEIQRYNLKLAVLESRLQEVEESRDKYLHRNQEIIYFFEKSEAENNEEITALEEELGELKIKEEQFIGRNKEFMSRNQRLKSDIELKEMSIRNLEEEVNRFNEEIQIKKKYNREQINKIVLDHEYDRTRRQQEKTNQIHKMTELETMLRNAQLENAKLRQQYAVLAQKLQISLGKAVQDVFTENNLY